MYGGILSTEFLDKFEEVTGDVIDESYLMMNFNDSIISFYYIMDIALKGGYGDLINNLLVLQKVIDPKPWKMLIVKLFGYSFLIIMEFSIMNILIVFVSSILGLYEGKNEEDI